MFLDVAKVYVKAGDGGAGAVTFHREKYVAAGGPDGGDGGRGGDIVFQVDDNFSTLVDFRFKKKYVAPNGEPGRGKKCYGKDGEDLVVKVPRGTLVRDASTGRIVADMSDDEPVIIAKGGRGGWGNTHFATSTRQIPRFAKPGQPGESMELQLELKLLADVGLVGYPNVGKSTLVSVCSDAKPVIANYHFTTITPVLGVVKVEEGTSFVMADIPGLIEGASEGVGLGHDFLRHVERCRLIVHIVDVSGVEGRDPIQDFETINQELRRFNPELAERPMLVAANKIDMASDEQTAQFRSYIEKKGYRCFEMSAAISWGVEPLVKAIAEELSKLPPIKRYEPEQPPVCEEPVNRQAFTVTKEKDVFIVDAPWLGPIMETINPEDYESLQYFQRVLRSSGIIDKLEELGVQEEDTVRIFDFEFEYLR